MRAAVIKQHGPPESISFEDRPVPAPEAMQVLVKIKACGLNHLDLWVRRGVPGHKFPLPLVPGSDITGIVDKAGVGVSRFKTGDRVIIDPALSCGYCASCQAGRNHLCARWGLLGETDDGGCQEYLAVHERQVSILPSQLTFEQGACIPINFVTAWQMLVGKAGIRPGETILIHGAGSGVSVACIQIAKMHGLQIFVTSSSEEKLQRTRLIGGHRFLNTSKESFREAVRNLTGKQGVDVVVDHVGEPTFMDSIRALKKGGRLVSCGATAGSELKIDWKHVFFKNLALLGSTYGTRGDFCEVLRHFESGKLTAVLDSTVKLADLARAHAALEERAVFGKTVALLP
ncbi:MAG: zinc-binding dehydrogenase [Deltaproteobacteria bacterium]|nr:zinc-binding dehydrogenase [Deltaproteobacteria bacterium]